MLFKGESNIFLTEAFYLAIVRIRNTLQNDHGMCRMKRGRCRGLAGKYLIRGSLKVRGNTSTSGTSGLRWPINARRKHTQNLLSIPIDTESETNAKPRPELPVGFSYIKRIYNGFWLQNQWQDIRRDSQSSFVASQFPLMLSGLAIDAAHLIRHRRVPSRLGPFVTSVRWNWIMDDQLSGSKRFESVLRTPIRHGVPLSRGRSRFLCSRLSFFFFSFLFVRFSSFLSDDPTEAGTLGKSRKLEDSWRTTALAHGAFAFQYEYWLPVSRSSDDSFDRSY